MTEFLLGFFIFFAGLFVGVVAAPVYAVGHRREDDFDGGFRHNHRQDLPRVITTIYSKDVTLEDK